MDLNTLTLYAIAAGLCFCLSLLLLAFAQIRRGTFLVRSSALAMATLAIGFFGAGFTPVLPFWVTVIGMNVLLLSAGAIFHAGIKAFVQQRPPRPDWPGFGVVLFALPFFVYWGFIDPDGARRSIVFSIATALINVRTAALMLGFLRTTTFRLSALILALVPAVITAWMVARTGYLLLAEPVAADLRHANPTTWPSVFGLNVTVSALVASILAIEIGSRTAGAAPRAPADEGITEPVRDNLALLWGIVAIVLMAIVSETGIAYLVLYQREREQLGEQASIANQAMAEHGQQLIEQADLILRATRDLAERGYPPQALANFIDGLGIPQSAVADVFLIGADGTLILPVRERDEQIEADARDYFQFHREHAEDVLHVGPVVAGLAAGKQQFRISRRVNDANGQFAGVVLVPLEPAVFIRYYQQMVTEADGVAALIGTDDHRIRARQPTADAAAADAPVDSPLWSMLSKASEGSYRHLSVVDGIERQFVYRRLQNLPLAMVSGYSDADVRRNALQSLKPLALGAVLATAVVIALAVMLASALRRREEQDRFLSMISHELRTPMSVIRMVSGSDAIPASVRTRVIRAVNDMSAIVDRALQADRLHHGRVRAHLTECEIQDLLDSIRQDVADPARVRIEAADAIVCRTDPQLLRLVLGNLLDNALKYSTSGSIVQVHAAELTLRGQPGVSISVSNRAGAAGAPDPRQVFRKFYRAPGARGKTGSGLGLHIAEGFARLLGGELKYFSEGDTVRFTLWMPS